LYDFFDVSVFHFRNIQAGWPSWIPCLQGKYQGFCKIFDPVGIGASTKIMMLEWRVEATSSNLLAVAALVVARDQD
jgi:hypothetical protein